MAQKTAKLSVVALILYNLTGGRIQLNDAQDPVGILELTAMGRKTGQPRKVTLSYIKSGPSYVVTASNAGRLDRHPAWYLNLLSNSNATIRIKNQQFKVVAEKVGPEQRKHLWTQLVEVAPMYAGLERRTQREIPMVFLRPVE